LILQTVNSDRFIHLVTNAELIAFQQVRYGYAVAAYVEAYYAPIEHPGGGNLAQPKEFVERLGDAFIKRMSTPRLRTLRPTAKPHPTMDLVNYLNAAFNVLDFDEGFKKAEGDHPAVVEYQCQVVIQALEEHQRPELKDAVLPVKRDTLDEAIQLIIEHAEAARELCEVGDWNPTRLKLHLGQCTSALKVALTLMLSP
jgi:hypothetical protein